MKLSTQILSLTMVSLIIAAGMAHASENREDAAVTAVRKNAERLATNFNSGDADAVTAMFLSNGELIDEDGTVYQGSQEIKDLLNAFFTKYPATKLSLDIESIRLAGPVAIEEGTRTMTAKDGGVASRFRYIAVWTQTDGGWKVASFRDFSDESSSTPHECLQPLAWLVGEWINEGADGKVEIAYRWSEDKNFLLGEFHFQSAGGVSRKSSQRIGWDPSVGKIRSWLFDADGGFSEGCWTVDEDGAVIKSSSVNPDGSTASATMTVVVTDKDHFSIAGTDRIVGDNREPDFKITVTRRPPAASN